MNNKGYSWPEALLTLTIVMVIFGTLLPLASHVTAQLQYKKSAFHASETAYQGAILYKAYGVEAGSRHVEGTDYDWSVEASSVCVTYKIVDKVEGTCIES